MFYCVMAVQDRASTHISIRSILSGKKYVIGTRVREVLCCAVFSVELLFCFSLSLLQFRTAETEWLCPCLYAEPNIFRCAPTITGKAFIHSAVKVPTTYRSCSLNTDLFTEYLIAKFHSDASEGALQSAHRAFQCWPLWVN